MLTNRDLLKVHGVIWFLEVPGHGWQCRFMSYSQESIISAIGSTKANALRKVVHNLREDLRETINRLQKI